MKVGFPSSMFVSAMIIMTFASLLVIVLMYQMDQIVHGVLYQFGLRFSYQCVWPYWIFSAMIIGFSWLIIVASIGLAYYFLKAGRQAQRAVEGGGEGEVVADDWQKSLSEYVEPTDTYVPSEEIAGETEGLIDAQVRGLPLDLQRVPIKKYDVSRPKDVVDSQC